MKTFLVVGTGRFGRHLCKRLYTLGYEVMAVDPIEDEIEAVLPYTVNSMIGDGTDEAFIQSLGVDNYDACFVTIGDNFQTSLQTTYLLKYNGAKKVVSRASNEIQESFLLRNGADAVIYPEREMAEWTAIRYSLDNVLNYIELPGANSIFEVEISGHWAGKTIGQLKLKEKYSINVMALRRGEELDMKIGDDTVLKKGHSLLVYGKDSDLRKCLNLGAHFTSD